MAFFIIFVFIQKYFLCCYFRDKKVIPETKQIPVADGLNTDFAWELTDWNPIDQIWMPYGNNPSNLGQEAGLQLWEGADDFTGKYKVVWSTETNLL